MSIAEKLLEGLEDIVIYEPIKVGMDMVLNAIILTALLDYFGEIKDEKLFPRDSWLL